MKQKKWLYRDLVKNNKYDVYIYIYEYFYEIYNQIWLIVLCGW